MGGTQWAYRDFDILKYNLNMGMKKMWVYVLLALCGRAASAQNFDGNQDLLQRFRDMKKDSVASVDAVPADKDFPAAKAPFDQLQAYFSQASVPSKQDVLGRRPGRCYTYLERDAPVGALLMGLERGSPSPDNGPLFPPADKILNLYPFSHHSGPANRYDNLSRRDREYFDEVSQTDKWLPSVRRDTSLEQINIDGNRVYSFKKFGDYILMKATAFREGEQVNAGKIYWMCYYFKKID